MNISTPIQKVVAYITRRQADRLQLLVFQHRDFPEAGLQVPAGTVAKGEALEAALFREIEEESGLVDLVLVRKLGHSIYYAAHKRQYHERHVYHLELTTQSAGKDTWEHTVRSHDEDEGLVFCYDWVDVKSHPLLAAGQGEFLGLLLE